MNNISNIIEDFILQQLLNENEVNLSRNQLASFFNVSPSQINYVLTTRFTPFKGFDVESKRGGGGYIKIYKISHDSDRKYFNNIMTIIGADIDYNSAVHILENLLTNKYINNKEYNIIHSTISPKSLTGIERQDNVLRASLLKNIVIELFKGE